MAHDSQVVITGVGVVSPIGIGKQAFWDSLRNGRGGVGLTEEFAGTELPYRLGAHVADFDPKQYVKPRKSLKVMCREIQTGFAASSLAMDDAGLEKGGVDPDRFGVVFGSEMFYGLGELETVYRHCTSDGEFDFDRWGENAMRDIEPLWMLKYLPNMVACHIGIAQDARGPNNTHLMREVSFLAALAESCIVIERGAADVMITGATGSRLNLMAMLSHGAQGLSRRFDDPAAAVRPFDAARDGTVNGEGAAALILESRRHAEARNAKIAGSVLGFATRFSSEAKGAAGRTAAIANSINAALDAAQLSAEDIGHVNANAAGEIEDDAIEAAAIAATLGQTPVTAPKSYFGNLNSGAGAVEAAVSVLSLAAGQTPVTLNYQTPDPACPLNVVRDGPQPLEKGVALLLNNSQTGQAAAAVLAGP